MPDRLLPRSLASHSPKHRFGGPSTDPVPTSISLIKVDHVCLAHLRKVVRPNFIAPGGSLDLSKPIRTASLDFFVIPLLGQTSTKHFISPFAVLHKISDERICFARAHLRLRAGILHGDSDTCWEMCQSHGRFGPIDMLHAVSVYSIRDQL